MMPRPSVVESILALFSLLAARRGLIRRTKDFANLVSTDSVDFDARECKGAAASCQTVNY
jgi:hypothetical protein